MTKLKFKKELNCSTSVLRYLQFQNSIDPNQEKKAMQYMNNGVLVLNSDLPENYTVVVDGINGCFCSSTNDFKEKLNQFYKMTDINYSWFQEMPENRLEIFTITSTSKNLKRLKTA